MWQAFLMRSALLMTSAALGGFGIFSIIYSFVVPSLAAQGLILLGAATAILYFTAISRRRYRQRAHVEDRHAPPLLGAARGRRHLAR